MDRIEKDSLGEKKIHANALYGIHALRARENFPCEVPFQIEWYKAVGLTKLACYNTYIKFHKAAKEKYGKDIPIVLINEKMIKALADSAKKISEGAHFDQFIVPAVQGGAGTSINMNINEIITNVALIKLGHKPGDYEILDPVESANVFQSTNDVIPTALTVAVMILLQKLEDTINNLRQKIESIEKTTRGKLRPGYTQMQEAVPSSYGILFGTYNEALSRDWWRVSKCIERIKVVNLGGGAIGTGMSVPLYFIMEVVPELRNITGLPLSRSENATDATSNLDRWVEMHATLKAHAVNLEKMVSDIRLLASDVAVNGGLSIPKKQVGSSIMPGKVNPVIPEFVISSSHIIYSNDMLISSLSGQGCLELNAYLPVIGNAIIESLKLLISCNLTLLENLVDGLSVSETTGYNALMHSPSLTTALSPYIGYYKAAEIANLMKEKGYDIFKANSELKILDEYKLRIIIQPGNLLKLGFSLEDL
jgi:aspartate ammonia-lyase